MKNAIEINAVIRIAKSIDERPIIQLVFELDGTQHRVQANLPREIESKIWWVAAGKPELPEWRL